MDNVTCKRCGEEYSSSYHKCPFCQEIAAERRGRPIYRRGKRLTKKQRSAGAGDVMKVVVAASVLCVMLVVVLWSIFGIRKPNSDPQNDRPEQNTPVDEQRPGNETGDDPVEPGIDDPGVSDGVALTLSQEAITINVGETALIVADGADGEIVWTSSNEEIAVVEDGSVTGIAGGTVTITATSGEETAVCTVTILGEAWTNPVELKLNSTDFTLSDQYPTFRLKVEGTDSTVIWSSSDTGIATVDETGMVRRAGRGTCTVTAEVDGQTLTCIVRVQGNVQGGSTELKLNRYDFTLSQEYPSFRLKVEGTDSAVVWSSSDTGVATVDETGVVRRVGRGTCTVTAEVDGQKLSCIVRVS